MFDPAPKFGELGGDMSQLVLQFAESGSHFGGCGLALAWVDDVRAASWPTLYQAVVRKLLVRALHRHERDVQLLGQTLGPGEAAPGRVQAVREVVAEPGSDLLGGRGLSGFQSMPRAYPT